jgi:hypothetical protein
VIGATIGSSAAGLFGMGFFRAGTGFGRIFGPVFFGFTVFAAVFFGFTVFIAAFVGLAVFAAVFGFTVFVAVFFGFADFVAAFFGFGFFFAIVLFSKKNRRCTGYSPIAQAVGNASVTRSWRSDIGVPPRAGFYLGPR